MKNRLALVSIASLIVIVISYGLLAIPGQFVGMFNDGKLFPVQGSSIAGYEYIFHCVQKIGDNENPFFSSGRASAAGIMAVIFMFFACGSFALHKKSTALPLLGGILETLSGFFFVMTTPFACLCYPDKISSIRAMWLPYVLGSVMVVLGLLAIYFSVVELKKEKVTLASKGGYSYLKK